MKSFYFRLLRLIWGLSLCAFGTAMMIKAHIGYAPWTVFHEGIAKISGTTIGTITIIATALICIIAVLIGEKIGLGTILDMILVGIFLDFFLWIPMMPVANHLLLSVIMLFIGLFGISLGCYFYIGAGLGAGPRDSIMVALTRKTGLPIGLWRGVIEALVLLIGWRLGGMVGLGTLLSAFFIGFCIQITFKAFKFDVTKVQHETLDYTMKWLFSKKSKKEAYNPHP